MGRHPSNIYFMNFEQITFENNARQTTSSVCVFFGCQYMITCIRAEMHRLELVSEATRKTRFSHYSCALVVAR